jgi:hypothetical protein
VIADARISKDRGTGADQLYDMAEFLVNNNIDEKEDFIDELIPKSRSRKQPEEDCKWRKVAVKDKRRYRESVESVAMAREPKIEGGRRDFDRTVPQSPRRRRTCEATRWHVVDDAVHELCCVTAFQSLSSFLT